MKKKLLVFFLFLLLLSPSPVEAGQEFKTTYEVDFNVLTNGQTQVSQKITLENRLARVHATKYNLTLAGIEVQNLTAYDEAGPLAKTITQKEATTQIELTFNQVAVGLGKTLTFTVAYETPDLASRQGQVWEINIPRLANVQEIDDYQARLLVPQVFGQIAYLSPLPDRRESNAGRFLFFFNKEQMRASGVKASFGQLQVFDFGLTYHLQNPHLSWAETEIALPPDTAFQKITFNQIEPLPENVRVDADGNWLARFFLKPNQNLEVLAQGQAKIFRQPRETYPSPLPETLRQNLASQEFWPKDSPLIAAQAKKLTTPRQIYDFVVQTLEYDYERVKDEPVRLGALTAWQNPTQALCMEFTDLFVALARAANIPARAISGYAYTANPKLKNWDAVTDILHSWPEYWDESQGLWLPVDPTWEKTSQGFDYFTNRDLSHFAFVIHGLDSQKPYPAGSYKTENNQGKDVQVVFGQYQGEEERKIEVRFNLPEQLTGRKQKNGEIIFKNQSGGALYDLHPQFEAKNFQIWPENDLIEVLPPFGEKKIELALRASAVMSAQAGQLTVILGEEKFYQTVMIASWWQDLLFPAFGFLACIGCLFYVKKKRQ